MSLVEMQLSDSKALRPSNIELITMRLTPQWEKAIATHSSTLAWKISWMGEPDRLQSIGS